MARLRTKTKIGRTLLQTLLLALLFWILFLVQRSCTTGPVKPQVQLHDENLPELREEEELPAAFATSETERPKLGSRPDPNLQAPVRSVPTTDDKSGATGQVTLVEGPSRLNYVWRLYDLYDQQEFILTPKARPTDKVNKSHKLSWRKAVASETVTWQWSHREDFVGATTETTTENSAALDQVYLGHNFWRVSKDGQRWSETLRFDVEPDFLVEPPPQVKIANEDVPLINEIAFVPVKIRNSFRALGYVMEASRTPNFEAGQTKSFWTADSEFRLSFFAPGDYYYRFRAVNNSQELTEWSLPQHFRVFTPSELLPPVPELEIYERVLREPARLTWTGDVRSKQFEVEVRNSQGKIVAGTTTDRNEWTWSSDVPGKFQARITAVDRWGRRSSPSKAIQLLYDTKIPARLAEKSLPPPPPAPDYSIANSFARREPVVPTYLNSKYGSSVLDVQGNIWALQSKTQDFNGEEMPVATGIGVHAQHWWDFQGVEGMAKSKAIGANAAGTAVSPTQLEARYHLRHVFGLGNNFVREAQVSAFAGYEVYRNTGDTTSFSPGYDLFKFGTSLEFPVARRLATGGEFVYGAGLEGSTLYEISGHLYYFLKKEWSAGVGYRLHLLEAASTAVSPTGLLPYREGYGEGYSVLRYHF